jgi:transporter family-2 protein
VGNPVQATTVAFFVATVVLLLMCTLNGSVRLVGKACSRDYPWWMWTGGLCGAMIVFGNAWLVPKVGVGVFSMALLVGQLALSMLMEHFGWLGAPRKPITWIKVVGILLMLGGVALIRL